MRSLPFHLLLLFTTELGLTGPYLIASNEVGGVEPKRLVVARVEDDLLLRILLQLLVELVAELIQVAQVIRPEVEVEVLVDDLILDVEVSAVARRFRFVASFQGCEV